MPKSRHASPRRRPLAAAGRLFRRWPWLAANREPENAVLAGEKLAAANYVIAPPVRLPVTLQAHQPPVVDREPQMTGPMRDWYTRGAEETSLDLPVISEEEL
jgi:hypothetical protein